MLYIARIGRAGATDPSKGENQKRDIAIRKVRSNATELGTQREGCCGRRGIVVRGLEENFFVFRDGEFGKLIELRRTQLGGGGHLKRHLWHKVLEAWHRGRVSGCDAMTGKKKRGGQTLPDLSGRRGGYQTLCQVAREAQSSPTSREGRGYYKTIGFCRSGIIQFHPKDCRSIGGRPRSPGNPGGRTEGTIGSFRRKTQGHRAGSDRQTKNRRVSNFYRFARSSEMSSRQSRFHREEESEEGAGCQSRNINYIRFRLRERCTLHLERPSRAKSLFVRRAQVGNERRAKIECGFGREG